MASASLSAIAGAFLAPLPQMIMDKLAQSLHDYLSSRDEQQEGEDDDRKSREELQQHVMALQDAGERIQGTLDVAKMLQKDDKSVANLLRKLKGVVDAAEDLADDLEYEKLKKRAEEEDDDEEEAADEANTSQSPAKRRRLCSPDCSSSSQDHVMIDNIKQIIKELDAIALRLERAIDMAMVAKKLKKPERKPAILNKRATTSSVNENKVYGRDLEKQRLRELCLEFPATEKISLISITGMGGAGKTTLAQCVFNDQRIKTDFDERVWVCVSDPFERLTVTRDIVQSLGSSSHATNLELLEGEMKKKLGGKRLLLVLDDVWSDEWRDLLVVLELVELKCAKIVVTTRDTTTLAGLGTRNRIALTGLEEDAYWSLFQSCAFGDEDPDKYFQLQSIGREIVKKLKGSPLAAKTVGRLLACDLSYDHWTYILHSDLWSLGTQANDIMPALALSYHHLPEHLQCCFAICSVYPKDFVYEPEKLIYLWMAHGYIKAEKETKRMEDIGREYLNELIYRSFFEESYVSFEYHGVCVKLHDLWHDLAQSVSSGECFIYEDGHRIERIPQGVRHLCIRSSNGLSLLGACKNFRTLVLFGVQLHGDNLEALKSIRALIMEGWEIQELPDAIGPHLKRLRYLDASRTSIQMLYDSLCDLYHLQALWLPSEFNLPRGITKLTGLRLLVPTLEPVPGIGKLTKLEKLGNFSVEKKSGCGIGQLKNMNQLGGQLCISYLERVKNKEEATTANLKEKIWLDDLKLSWSGNSGVTLAEEEVLEGLHPPPSLQALQIEGYMGSTHPSWILGCSIKSLDLRGCVNWTNLSPLRELPLLQSLYIIDMDGVTIEKSDEVAVAFPSLELLYLVRASLTFQGSVTTQGANFFPLLSDLEIINCNQLTLLANLQALTSIERLTIGNYRELTSLEMLPFGAKQEGPLLPRLRIIWIDNCRSLEFLPAWLSQHPSLEELNIKWCGKMASLPKDGLPSSLRKLEIVGCDPGLVARCQEDGSPEWQIIHRIPTRNISQSTYTRSSSSLLELEQYSDDDDLN